MVPSAKCKLHRLLAEEYRVDNGSMGAAVYGLRVLYSILYFVIIIVYAGHNEPTVTAVSIEMSGVLLIIGIILLEVEHFTPLTLCTG
jgi:hypothetical protein